MHACFSQASGAQEGFSSKTAPAAVPARAAAASDFSGSSLDVMSLPQVAMMAPSEQPEADEADDLDLAEGRLRPPLLRIVVPGLLRPWCGTECTGLATF